MNTVYDEVWVNKYQQRIRVSEMSGTYARNILKMFMDAELVNGFSATYARKILRTVLRNQRLGMPLRSHRSQMVPRCRQSTNHVNSALSAMRGAFYAY